VARLKQSLPGNMPPAANAREVYSAQSHSAWAGQLHEQTEAWQPRCLPLVSVFNELEHIRRAGIDRDDIVRDWTLRRLGRRRNTLGRRRNTARRWHDATRRRAARGLGVDANFLAGGSSSAEEHVLSRVVQRQQTRERVEQGHLGGCGARMVR
jgi:hypothetical protein